MRGVLMIIDGVWQCKHVRWVNNFDMAIDIIPLHPDDIQYAEHNKHVEFEVETIATGTSEFDIEDMDVAKLITVNNLKK